MGIFDFFRKNRKPPKLMPESLVEIYFDDKRVWCTSPGKPMQEMRWSKLIGVAVETTDEGSLLPDVFFILGAKDFSLVFPQGATGDQEMLHRLQDLPGFDNEVFIEAMTCTDNKTFICWEKPRTSG